MENNDNIRDELKDIAPNLLKIKRKNSFSVPDDYFETLPNIIQERCIQIKKESVWSIFFKYLLKPQYSLSLALVIAVLALGIQRFGVNESDYRAAAPNKEIFITAEDLSNSYYINEFDENMLVENVTLNVSTLKYTKNTKTELENIENYLIENNTDVSLIISEL